MHILVVDDDTWVCEQLCEYLEGAAKSILSSEITVQPTFRFDDAVTALNGDPPPGLVFLDLGLGTSKGLSTFLRFKEADRKQIKTPIVLFTGLSLEITQDLEILRECMPDFGSEPGKRLLGILLKSGNNKDMFFGLSRLLAGEEWVATDLYRKLVLTPPPGRQPQQNYGLTDGEWRFARCLMRGLSDRKIAKELNVTDGHVRQVNHIIYEKLGVGSRTEAAIKLMKDIT